jgi:adenylyltransferase/sulfurtransferase
MNDDQLLRYSRHILMPQIDIAGQDKIRQSHVLIVGVGGLGSPVAMYLAASGVGTLTLVDNDVVELSNLQRQILHAESDVGRQKVDSAQEALQALNSDINIQTVARRLDNIDLGKLVGQADVVVDCTDNFETRFVLNKVIQQLKTPLVSAAAIRMEGQVTVFDPRIENSACYRCVYKESGELQESCADTGVLSPLLAIIGGVQAVETLKLLAGFGETLAGRLLLLDAFRMEWREIKLKKNIECPICNE